MSRAAAFFDIDGTLVKSPTQEALAAVMKQRGVLSPFWSARIGFWFLAYKAGLILDSVEFRRKAYRIFNTRPKEAIDRIFRETAGIILNTKLRKEMRQTVEIHQRHGDMVFTVTASLEALCLPVSAEFQISDCSATRLIVENGRYTGAWAGEILEGGKKVDRMKELSHCHGIDLSISTAYADSFSDLPMLEAVGRPVAVSPDPRLRRYALAHHWPMIDERF